MAATGHMLTSLLLFMLGGVILVFAIRDWWRSRARSSSKCSKEQLAEILALRIMAELDLRERVRTILASGSAHADLDELTDAVLAAFVGYLKARAEQPHLRNNEYAVNLINMLIAELAAPC